MALKNISQNLVAFAYDLLMLPIEKYKLQKLRRRILKLVNGENILELGVGTGLNIPVYPDGIKIIGIEPRLGMLERANKRSKRFGKKTSFICARAEALPLKDGAFDTVIATFVFCEVKNPEKGFSEILRVLKPGGKLILLEHVRPSGKIISGIFDALNVITSVFGENINRKTVETAVKSGFLIEKVEDIYNDVVKLIIGTKGHLS